jgi:uncharacterized protein YndB with AHSA1/START domain
VSDGYADYEEDGGRATVTFSRSLAHAPAAVWPALTEPARLAHWFPATVTADWRPGGAMRFAFPDGQAPESVGEVTELEPDARLTFTWGKEILRLELEPDAHDERTRLHFTQLLADPTNAARDAAGWHVCLDRLATHLDGGHTSAPGTERTAEWQALHDAYAARGFPAAAG